MEKSDSDPDRDERTRLSVGLHQMRILPYSGAEVSDLQVSKMRSNRADGKEQGRMKIEDKRDEFKIFGELYEGEVFTDVVTGNFYIKIDEAECDGDIVNAVRLDYGTLSCYAANHTVRKLNAKVVIE